MKRSLLRLVMYFALSFSVGWAAVVSAAPAETNILFILDASGSMWGKLEGKTKIDIAKDVMSGLIRDLPPEAKVGLMVFGHRREGDCADIELVAPLAKGPRDRPIKAIKALQPKGKTPISGSIRQAVAQLKGQAGARNIVLVSDGKETCAEDPSLVVKELKESGVMFAVHVVGFDVTDEERAQLEAIAKAGGGQYFNARTASEFKAAMAKVKEETLAKLEKPVALKEKAYALPKGGERPETAVVLNPANYYTEHSVPKGGTEFYMIKVKAGQTLQILVRTPVGSGDAGVIILDEKKRSVAGADVIGGGKSKTLSWTPGGTADVHSLYVGVGTNWGSTPKGTAYVLSLVDHFDANSETDAGDTFERALAIKPGKHSGFVVDKGGDDHRDFYRLAVKEKEQLTVRVTPETESRLQVAIFDQDRVKVASKASANEGAIARVSWKAPEEQKVYVLVELVERYGGNYPAGKYVLEIAVKK